MSIEEALQILRNRGYQIVPMPEHMPRPAHWWMSDPGIESFDAISERDIMMLAEALHYRHRCHYCGEQAESQCPICHLWTCYDDRRDSSPDFDQHWCPDCVGKHNAIVESAVLAAWHYR